MPVLVGELRCDSPRGEQVQARLPRLLSLFCSLTCGARFDLC